MPIIPSEQSTPIEYRVVSLQINRNNELLVNYLDDYGVAHQFILSVKIQAFPIGAIYFNVSGTNPATQLNYGTWVLQGSGKLLPPGPVVYMWKRTE